MKNKILLLKSPQLISLLLLCLLGFIWGTGYSIARFAMTNGVSPLGYSLWQALGPAVTISIIFLLKNRGQKIKPIINQGWFNYFICGLTGIVIPNTVMYFSAAHLPASILAMVVNIVPVIAYPLALIFGLEVFHWQRLLGIFLATSGLLCIILPQTSLPSAHLIPWVLFSLITPISFAFCSIFIAKSHTHSNSLLWTAGMLFSATILLTPLVIFSHSFYFLHFPLLLPDWIILLEILLSSLGYFLFFQLIKLAGPVYYSLVDTVVVLTGIGWGYIIFGEKLNQWTTTAMFLILFALVLVTQQQKLVWNLEKASKINDI